MSKTSSATVSVTVTGDGMALTDSDTVINATGVAPTSQALTSGANTITVPSGVVGVKIKPPPTNTQSLTLKGVSGDTGILIAKASPSYLSLDPTVTTFVLTAGGNVTVLFVWD